MPWHRKSASTAIAEISPCCNDRLFEPLRYAFAAFNIGLRFFQSMDFQLCALSAGAHSFLFICDSSSQKFCKFSRKDRPAGSQPAFAWDTVSIPIRPHYKVGIRFSSVPYPRFYRLSLRSAFRISEKARAYHVSRNQPCRLGAAYPPAVLFVHVFPAYRGTSDCTPFGSGLSASLAWFPLTTFNSDLLTFTILHKPSSPAGRCFQLFASASRFRLDPFGRAAFSRHAASRPLPAASVTIGYC